MSWIYTPEQEPPVDTAVLAFYSPACIETVVRDASGRYRAPSYLSHEGRPRPSWWKPLSELPPGVTP